MSLKDLKKGDFIEFISRPAPRSRGSERWHVVRMRSGSEHKTARELTRYSFETYSPQTRIFRPVAQRHMSHSQRKAGGVIKKPQLIPIYPGYMFVHLDLDRGDWARTFDFLGIYGLVCAGETPTVVRESEITRVRGMEIEGVIPPKTRMADVIFQIGETVRINEGPFRSFDATIEELPVGLEEKLKTHSIEELDDSFRATVAVNIFGRASPIELPFSQFEKIAK